MKKNALSLALTGALIAFASQAAMAAPDWSKVPKTDIHVFHPGVTAASRRSKPVPAVTSRTAS